MVTFLAVIVPTLSTVPFALTHDPTARLPTAAFRVWLKVVDPLSVTVTVLVLGLEFFPLWGASDFTLSC
jgi:hypothetical protein